MKKRAENTKVTSVVKAVSDVDENEAPSVVLRGIVSILRVLIILGLFFYVLYHLTNGFSAEMKTEIVKIYSEPVMIDVSGIVVRDETVINHSAGGAVSYRYENGARISKDAKVAVVYGSASDAETVARVAEIDRNIDFLEELGKNNTISATDGITAARDISGMVLDVSARIANGDFGGAALYSDELVRTFIVKRIALGGGTDSINAQIDSLKAERVGLSKSLSGAVSTVTASVPGYFYDYADGAEGVFDYSRVTSVTPKDYKEAIEKIAVASSDAVGKTVSLPKWYFVCELEKDDCVALKQGNKYSLLFGVNEINIDMDLEAKNTVGEETVLVFSTNRMPDEFDFGRNQDVSIISETVSGYRVPSSALRVVDSTVGVYIRSGNTVKFRVAEVIYESGAYSYISTESEGKTLYAADDDVNNDIYCKGLSLYDNVIIGGSKDLSPGRIVN